MKDVGHCNVEDAVQRNLRQKKSKWGDLEKEKAQSVGERSGQLVMSAVAAAAGAWGRRGLGAGGRQQWERRVQVTSCDYIKLQFYTGKDGK